MAAIIAGDYAVRRRSAACEAGQGTLRAHHRANALPLGQADHLLDLIGGVRIVAQGMSDEVAAVPESFTGYHLTPILEKLARQQGNLVK